MSQDLMRYDLMAQEALRGVVRSALETAARQGLPGDHHFYIAFATNAPGVQISHRLREQYPEEMTIVLQHQFTQLEVGPKRFSVQLSFNNIPETLIVPLAAVKGFYDPSVQFGLQFDLLSNENVRPDGKAESPAAANADANSPGGVAEDQDLDDDTAASQAVGGADVVSLDQFRRS